MPDGAGAQSGGNNPTEAAREGHRYRVMIVEDSAVVRSLLTRILEADPEIAVVASYSNGQQAVTAITRHHPDIVVLDIEMPVMDGLTALPQLIAAVPGLKVIMASTLTRRNADISLQALSLGAADYIAKPENKGQITASDFADELLRKVKVLARVGRGARRPEKGAAVEARPARDQSFPLEVPDPGQPISLRQPSTQRPGILAIGSSTGGPKALLAFLEGLDRGFALPIVIAQHMPATFTAILAEHIERRCGLTSREAGHEQPVLGGHVYVAPGDYHTTVARKNGALVTLLDQGPRENFCRPAVDRLLRSVSECFGPAALAVILTGMGQDGLRGCQTIVAGGGAVIAQDAATSVVWGMPGVVAEAGLASAVLPVDEIAGRVNKLALG